MGAGETRPLMCATSGSGSHLGLRYYEQLPRLIPRDRRNHHALTHAISYSLHSHYAVEL